MIADLKPYPEYQKPESRWLGHVPSNWSQRKLLTLSTLRVERNPGNIQLLSVFLNRGVIPYHEGGGQVHAPSLDLSKYQVVYPGDFVLNNQQAWRGSVGVSRYHGIISPAYIVLRLSSTLNSEYTNYLMQSAVMVDQFVTASKGVGDIQRTIYWPYLKTAQIPLPPPDEQVAIVRFLNHTNQRIERTIRAKRKVITLLNEQKQVIIHRAVTRGIDPNVRLKPSGISWLGEIPEHWEARRIKQITKILRGKFSHRPRNDQSLYDGPYPFIQTGAVARADKYITSYKQTLNKKGLAVSKLFPKNTLVMTIAANIGDVAVLTFDACFPDSVVGFIPAKEVDQDYLYLAFLCMKPELLQEAPVNTQGNLNVERIGSMGVPLPPIDEQRGIVLHIDDETKNLITTISRTEREIDLLREYRTRLIADVVTGKLDVRKAAAQLPDEVEEPVESEDVGEEVDSDE